MKGGKIERKTQRRKEEKKQARKEDRQALGSKKKKRELEMSIAVLS